MSCVFPDNTWSLSFCSLYSTITSVLNMRIDLSVLIEIFLISIALYIVTSPHHYGEPNECVKSEMKSYFMVNVLSSSCARS